MKTFIDYESLAEYNRQVALEKIAELQRKHMEELKPHLDVLKGYEHGNVVYVSTDVLNQFRIR